jgi:prophage antirepressor-like protein
VRTLLIEGEPWFVGKDICDALELKDARTSLKLLDDDDRHTVPVIDSLGRNQDTLIVNEPGMYTLVLKSRKPEAKAFRRWITHEVLPSIRKTGQYTLQVPKTFAEALRIAADMAEEKERLTKQLEAAQPAIDFVEQSVNTGGTFSLGEAAKMLNLKTPDGKPIGRNLLTKGLRLLNILMKQGEYNVPLQEHIRARRFEVKFSTVTIGNAEVSVPTTRVTPKGLQWIRVKCLEAGCTPVKGMVLSQGNDLIYGKTG